MERGKSQPRHCAIYTRKSSEEGLEQDFNSLHAQREACEAFIKSQHGRGLAADQDRLRRRRPFGRDHGTSGPAAPAGRHPRAGSSMSWSFTRSIGSPARLADFAKMVEVFDAHGVSFVAVTQQFNTTTSMGRLTLNVLLSFAQFEREVTGERIRDKIAASKRKGMWMGGSTATGLRRPRSPAGQSIRPKPRPSRDIFQRYLELGSVRLLKDDLDRRGIISKIRLSKNGNRSGGTAFSRGALYELLSNPVYIGEIRHRKERHPGQHQPMVEP